MSRANERKDAILDGLREHATIVGAARAARVSPGTVRKFLDADEDARQALAEGVERKVRDRIRERMERVHAAGVALDVARDETDALREKIAKEHPGMDYLVLREEEAKLKELCDGEKPLLSKLRRMRRALKQARDRARAGGIDPDAPPGEA